MPSGGALFGNSSSGPGSTGGVKHLVEFRAGKMNLKGRMVHPDKRKGLLYIYQSEDSLMHFCWQDRHSGVVEDDLIIFPDDCEYARVTQCTTGRVYVLKFKSSNRKLFFWMQCDYLVKHDLTKFNDIFKKKHTLYVSLKTFINFNDARCLELDNGKLSARASLKEPRCDRDDDYCKRINEYLNNPPGNLPSNNATDQDLQSLLNNMSQSQLMQLFGGVGQLGGLSSLLGTMGRPSTGTRSGSNNVTPAITHRPNIPSTPTTASGTANTTTTTTTASGASPAPATGTPSGLTTPQQSTIPVTTPDTPVPNRHGATQLRTEPIQLSDLRNFLRGISTPDQSVDLSSALTADALSGILNNTEAIEHLQDYLPAVDGNTQEQLRSTLASPQFQQAVSQFSSALQSGQLGPVVSQLAVNSEAVAAATEGNMQEFVRALEKNTSSSSSTKEKDEDKNEQAKTDTPTKKDPKKDDDEGMQLD